MAPTPVFLLSLPRSGSTLLQRLLATSPEVVTESEPWVLLPLVYTTRRDGVLAEYRHDLAVRGIADLTARLPRGEADYREELREMALRLYGKLAPEAAFFVDKTPSYLFIAEDLVELFPDARFVVLWRNPLAVVASMCRAWHDGRWSTHRWRTALDTGPPQLLAALRRAGERATTLRYEDLVTEPGTVMARLFAELGIAPGDPGDLGGVSLHGSHGDKIGAAWGDRIVAEPVGAWVAWYDDPVLRRWARRYLERLGAERLEAMGYPPERIVADLALAPTRWRPVASHQLYAAFDAAYAAGERLLWDTARRRRLLRRARHPVSSAGRLLRRATRDRS